MKWILVILSLCSLLYLVGCSAPLRTKGGTTSHTSATGAKTELVQSDLPNKSSTIDVSSKVVEEMVIPPQSVVTIPSLLSNKPPVVVNVSSDTPMVIKRVIEDKASNEVGSSWRDKVGETLAVMRGMKPVMFAGILVFLLGAATLHPKLKLILGFSNTQSMVVMGGGLALVFLPSIFVQNATLITILSFVGIAGYVLVYRYSKHSTEAKVYKQWVDKNKDGVRTDDEMV